jgi:amino acid transporter
MLIATSVFWLAFAYTATSASIFSLRRKGLKSKFSLIGGPVIPVLGILFSLFLISQCTILQITIGSSLLLVGIPIYFKFSPKREITELRENLLKRRLEALFGREELLAHTLRHLKKALGRITSRDKRSSK